MIEAEGLFRDGLDALTRKRGEKHPLVLKTMNNLAALDLDLGKLAEAESLYKPCMERAQETLGAQSEYTLRPMHGLAFTYFLTNRFKEAEPLFRKAYDGYLKLQGANGPMVVELTINMALVLQNLGQHAQAEQFLRKLLEIQRSQHKDDSYPVAQAKVGLGGNLFLQKKWVEAEQLLREGLAFREKNLPDDWSTYYARNLVGGCLTGQKKYAEAEPLIVGGYEGMKERESSIPGQVKSRLVESGERVVQLYGAWGKPEKAAEWRAKLAAKP